MGKIVFATGGARSGKSTFSENYIKARYDRVAYIATAVPFDDEMKDRIAKHQAQRPGHWQTLEAYQNLHLLVADIASRHEACLLDCMTIYVTNHMMDACDWIDWNQPSPELVNRLQAQILAEVKLLLDGVKASSVDFVFVSNELGMGLVPENPMARAFRDIAGRVNQLVASEADEAYLLVSGLPIALKGAGQ